jgi:glycosyltransferase involved in cell wall biosynthesis/uncharacterized protein YjbI with pentapeptide repeats
MRVPARVLIAAGAFLLLLVLFQLMIALRYAHTSAVVMQELRSSRDPNAERLRQQAAALRIENEQRTWIVTSFLANIGAGVGMLLAMVGAFISVQQFVNARSRERLDRAATELNDLWEGLLAEQPEKRAASVAALRQFLTPDKAEYHGRVASALAICGRDNDPVVSRTLVPVVEDAFRLLSHDIIAGVSWRGIHLPGVNLAGMDLHNLDLREAVLDGAVLAGANLSAARLHGASLLDADARNAIADDASLTGASLHRASLECASLRNADLRKADLLFTDLKNAVLTGATLPADDSVLRRSRNWRGAELDPPVRKSMIERYGDVAGAPRVLMLMWEYPPYVTGGGWTAAYNFVSELRLLGRSITLLVPWPTSAIDLSIFGGEVEVIGTGSDEDRPRSQREFYYSGYSGYSSGFQRFKADVDEELAGAYVAPTHSIMRLVSDFRTKARDAVREHELQFDLVHAHDWLALEAAMPIAQDAGKPLIAHLHSTERDRQKEPSRRIAAVEHAACQAAAEIVVPSSVLEATVRETCGVPEERTIQVIANPPSTADSPSRGQFGTDRVIFLGRLTWQKAPDLFVRIADRVRDDIPTAELIMFGDGDELRKTAELIDTLRPLKPSAAQRRGSYERPEVPMEFERIRQVDFHPATHSFTLRSSPILSAHPGSFLHHVGDHVLSIVPVQGFKNYTHHLYYSDQHFLIATDLLPGYAAARDRFVVLGGTLPWHQRHLALDEATVVVIPSRSEPFGMVILEAMQSGVPVVCSNRAGALEFVRPAAVFDPQNELESAAAQVVTLLTNEKAWIEAVESQRASVDQFVASAPWRKLDELWREASATPSAARTPRSYSRRA